MDTSENPLQDQLQQQLVNSEWLKKFRAIAHLLTTLKAEMPIIQQCDLKWDTTVDCLIIHCPDSKTLTSLSEQSAQLHSLRGCARKIIIRHPDMPDVVI